MGGGGGRIPPRDPPFAMAARKGDGGLARNEGGEDNRSLCL
jgi:hypothetical protein